jgi:hypothetical protein
MKKAVVISLLMLATFYRGYGWGFYAHRLINQQALFLLPPSMISLYKLHILYIGEHAVDPDKRRYAVADEGPRHYIDMDRYEKDAFRSMNVSWSQACKTHSEDTLRAHGIVPWWIQVMLARLTQAFRDGNLNRILKVSAELGHYVGDAHVPLHTSSNHNGQHTNQHGIHGFWESRIPELLAESEWDLWIGRAQYIKDPLQYTWRIIHESAKAADSVLFLERKLNERIPAQNKYAFENRNGVLTKQYSDFYTRKYDHELNGMVERRFRQSVLAVASFWYTAWVNAGQPDCRKIAGMENTPDDVHEYETLNLKWKEGRILGRHCEP